MIAQKSLGECPVCGDELFVFRTRSRKRLAKCVNDECPNPPIFGIPKSGSIEVTGEVCPKNGFPLIAIVPNLRLTQGRYKSQIKKTYFWTNGPCFTCSKQDRCDILKELCEDYLDD
jgi:ssDNA-binding Zn-finger/Zn-ribbon topoisomerase 1